MQGQSEDAVTVAPHGGDGDPVAAAEQEKPPLPIAPEKPVAKAVSRLADLGAEQKRLDEEIAAEAKRVAGTGEETTDQVAGRFRAFIDDIEAHERLFASLHERFKDLKAAASADELKQVAKYTVVERSIFIDLLSTATREIEWQAQRRRELEARVAALEAREAYAMDYRGLWEPGRYPVGAFVTLNGSLWRSKCTTTQKPGDGPAWNLVVARGKPGMSWKEGRR